MAWQVSAETLPVPTKQDCTMFWTKWFGRVCWQNKGRPTFLAQTTASIWIVPQATNNNPPVFQIPRTPRQGAAVSPRYSLPHARREIAAIFNQDRGPDRRPHLPEIHPGTKRPAVLDRRGLDAPKAQGASVLRFGPDSERPPQVARAGKATAQRTVMMVASGRKYPGAFSGAETGNQTDEPRHTAR